MNRKDTVQLIDGYFSGALSPGEERLLFSMLTTDEQSRGYFKDSMVIKTATQLSTEPVPAGLDERIINAVVAPKTIPFRQEFFHIRYLPQYAVTLVFLVITAWFYFKMDFYKQEIDNTMTMVRNQQNTIELLMNGLPTVQITAATNNKFHTTDY